MVNQNLVMFIQNSLQNGLDINSIRNQLLAQGYSVYDIDTAINFLYNRPTQVHHTISFSKSAIIAICAILLGLALTGYLVLTLTSNQKAPNKLLDFETAPIKTAVKPGEALQFKISLFNMGNSPRYDVVILSTLLDSNNKEIGYKEDTFAVEKRTTETMLIEIPANAEPGTYSVRSTATYSQGKATSSFQFTIYKESATPTCFDNVQNQGEAGVDCGGPCKPCASCYDGIQNQGETGIDCGGQCKACEIGCGNCDDNNVCTTDSCQDGQCAHVAITPCCGNGICESGESEQTCSQDCNAAPEESPSQIIDAAGKLSKTDPNSAKKLCDSLREVPDKDHCFEAIAKAVNQSIACSYINSTANRDACYMHFAMRYDYSVCDKVDNPYLQKSCESLKYIQNSA